MAEYFESRCLTLQSDSRHVLGLDSHRELLSTWVGLRGGNAQQLPVSYKQVIGPTTSPHGQWAIAWLGGSLVLENATLCEFDLESQLSAISLLVTPTTLRMELLQSVSVRKTSVSAELTVSICTRPRVPRLGCCQMSLPVCTRRRWPI